MKKTIAIDLDGVLAEYHGWHGVTHIGDPIPGALEFVENLHKDYYICIHTTRGSVDVQAGWNVKTLYGILANWLNGHGFAWDNIHIGSGKPIASAYVDDRAVVCRPQQDGPTSFEKATSAIENLCAIEK